MTYTRATLLICLYNLKEATQAQICQMLDLDKGSVTRMLLHLESDGLIVRCVNPSDKRAVLVRLSEKALSLIPHIERIQNKWIISVTSDLSDLEKKVFSELLQTVADAALGEQKKE